MTRLGIGRVPDAFRASLRSPSLLEQEVCRGRGVRLVEPGFRTRELDGEWCSGLDGAGVPPLPDRHGRE